MKIYVGRWDLLPDSWEGYNGLSEKVEPEISKEVSRQNWTDEGYIDPFVGIYTPQEFEETFNQDLNGGVNTKKYWIKIF